MKEFYLRRIEKAKRIRLRVVVEDSTATIFLTSFFQADRSNLPGTWTLEEKTYDLEISSQCSDYEALIKGSEACPKSEYCFAFSEAVEANRLGTSPISRHNYSLPKNGQINLPIIIKKEYLIPSNTLIKKIEDFFKSAGKH